MSFKKNILQYLIAGTFVEAIDFSIYYFLIGFLSFSFSKGIAFTCAGIVAYFLNKYWTFSGSPPASYLETGRYLITNFVALGINVLTNQSILNAWPNTVFGALIIASMVTGVLSFVFFKWWVFKVPLIRFDH